LFHLLSKLEQENVATKRLILISTDVVIAACFIFSIFAIHSLFILPSHLSASNKSPMLVFEACRNRDDFSSS
jgi:hypothetical protein